MQIKLDVCILYGVFLIISFTKRYPSYDKVDAYSLYDNNYCLGSWARFLCTQIVFHCWVCVRFVCENHILRYIFYSYPTRWLFSCNKSACVCYLSKQPDCFLRRWWSRGVPPSKWMNKQVHFRLNQQKIVDETVCLSFPFGMYIYRFSVIYDTFRDYFFMSIYSRLRVWGVSVTLCQNLLANVIKMDFFL